MSYIYDKTYYRFSQLIQILIFLYIIIMIYRKIISNILKYHESYNNVNKL